MTTDRELLLRYVQEGAEEPLAEVVRRHVDLVYGTALRQLCGHAALAETVTQAVFASMAAKAAALAQAGNLPAWLYAATHAAVTHAVRAERRRPARSPKSSNLRLAPSEAAASRALEVPAALVDEALQALDADELESVLRRFMAGSTPEAAGAGPLPGEEVTRRAVEKIRSVLARNALNLSASEVQAALTQHAMAAPDALAEHVAAASFAAGAVAVATDSRRGWRSLVASPGGLAWIGGMAFVMVLGFAIHERLAAEHASDEAASLRTERDQLREDLAGDEARYRELAHQASETGQRMNEMQHRVDDLATASAARAAAAESAAAAKPPPPAGDDAKKRIAERLAQMRPLLAAGTPIKGGAVVMVGGKPVSHPVEFVMGREARIEADEGVYVVKPALRDDGTVEYDVTLQKKPADGNPVGEDVAMTKVVQVPWSGFVVTGDQGTALAFDPDETMP